MNHLSPDDLIQIEDCLLELREQSDDMNTVSELNNLIENVRKERKGEDENF